jgi:hypothetical protein
VAAALNIDGSAPCAGPTFGRLHSALLSSRLRPGISAPLARLELRGDARPPCVGHGRRRCWTLGVAPPGRRPENPYSAFADVGGSWRQRAQTLGAGAPGPGITRPRRNEALTWCFGSSALDGSGQSIVGQGNPRLLWVGVEALQPSEGGVPHRARWRVSSAHRPCRWQVDPRPHPCLEVLGPASYDAPPCGAAPPSGRAGVLVLTHDGPTGDAWVLTCAGPSPIPPNCRAYRGAMTVEARRWLTVAGLVIGLVLFVVGAVFLSTKHPSKGIACLVLGGLLWIAAFVVAYVSRRQKRERW